MKVDISLRAMGRADDAAVAQLETAARQLIAVAQSAGLSIKSADVNLVVEKETGAPVDAPVLTAEDGDAD